jgi:rRNA-processing protein FCF1
VHAAGSGDDAIVDVVRRATGSSDARPVTVVTADRGLRERVRALGAQTMGPGALWDRLDRAGGDPS